MHVYSCIATYVFNNMLLPQVFSIIIAAYHSELYFARDFESAEDQPVLVCAYNDPDDDYYGYRACSNSIAAAIVAIFVCNVLLIIDLLIPCLNAGVSTSEIF